MVGGAASPPNPDEALGRPAAEGTAPNLKPVCAAMGWPRDWAGAAPEVAEPKAVEAEGSWIPVLPATAGELGKHEIQRKRTLYRVPEAKRRN